MIQTETADTIKTHNFIFNIYIFFQKILHFMKQCGEMWWTVTI